MSNQVTPVRRISPFLEARMLAMAIGRLNAPWLSDWGTAIEVLAKNTKLGAFDINHQSFYQQCGFWQACGCPTFSLSHKQWALLGTTSAHRDLLSELVSPFPTFAILTSDGLLKVADGNVSGFSIVSSYNASEYRKVMEKTLAGKYEGVMAKGNPVPAGILDTDLLWRVTSFTERTILTSGPWSTVQLLERGSDSSILSEDEYGSIFRLNDSDGRAITATARVVIGLCLSLDRRGSTFSNFQRVDHSRNTAKGLREYTEYKLTGSVSIDVRDQLRESVLSGTGDLHTQTLVRGHWKLQPCGPGRVDRKPIHVLPYWRGPLDAPVALRCPV